ncbi:MAG: thermonuclease family protein [Terrimesophilobacter sp.]
MKRATSEVLIIVVLAFGAFWLISQSSGTAPTSGPAVEQPAATDQAPAAAANLSRPATATLSHVAHVHDGDTLYLQPDGTTSRADEITVRLLGIDTPELRPSVECFAVEARDHLRALLPQGAEVWILADKGLLDKYGRSLLYLWTKDGHFVNMDLVANGYATALRIKPNEAYWPELRDAETAARAQQLGQWGHC